MARGLLGLDDETAELAWFDDVTRHLKSNLHGQPAADEAMLAFFETELLDNAQWKNQVAQMGENKWVQRFVEVKGRVGGGGAPPRARVDHALAGARRRRASPRCCQSSSRRTRSSQERCPP